jgi:hypothetical protein
MQNWQKTGNLPADFADVAEKAAPLGFATDYTDLHGFVCDNCGSIFGNLQLSFIEAYFVTLRTGLPP